MANPRATITVFRVTGIKPQIQSKRFALWLCFQKFDAPVYDQLGLMTQTAIRLFFVIRISADRFEFIKVLLSLKLLRHLRMPFSIETDTISVFPQQICIQGFDSIGTSHLWISGRTITAPR